MKLPFSYSLFRAAIEILGLKDFTRFSDETLSQLQNYYYVVDVWGLLVWSIITVAVGLIVGTRLGIGVERARRGLGGLKESIRSMMDRDKEDRAADESGDESDPDPSIPDDRSKKG